MEVKTPFETLILRQNGEKCNNKPSYIHIGDDVDTYLGFDGDKWNIGNNLCGDDVAKGIKADQPYFKSDNDTGVWPENYHVKCIGMSCKQSISELL